MFSVYYNNRLQDVTKLKSVAADWEQFMQAFWNDQLRSAAGRPIIVFLGSSFTYGYPWEESAIFSKIFSDRLLGWKVINLSHLSADISGIQEYLFCPLENSSLKPDILVAEIPLVNSITHLKTSVGQKKRECAGEGNKSYFDFVVSRPKGIGWIPLLWDAEAYKKPEHVINFTHWDDGYFTSKSDFLNIENVYRTELRAYLEKLSKSAKNVYVFVSPVYLDGLIGDQRVLEAVQQQIRVSWDVCNQISEINCVSLQGLDEDKRNFYNLTHLSKGGHLFFANQMFDRVFQKAPN